MTPHDPTAALGVRRRRRRASTIAAALVLVGTGSLVAWGSQAADAPPPTSAPASAAAPVRDASPAPQVEKPVELTPEPTFLRVPSIGVATPLIQLGLRADDTVEVPGNADDAGWFDLGTSPGDVGSAVILGHVDSLEGPAVFARLQELAPGQRVEVDAADGRTNTFEVRAVETVPNEDFPAEKVYASQRGRNLNLVTCGGTYDEANGGYQSNVIVYTRLVGTKGPRSG